MGKFKKLFIIAGILIFFILLSFIPTLRLKTNGMIIKETDNFIFYYEPQDERAVLDMCYNLENFYKRINSNFNFTLNKKTEVYIYPNLKSFHTKKYGWLGSIIAPDWYIGDNIKDKMIIVSPLNPGPVHDYKSIVEAIVHEYVHTIVYRINKKAPKFLNEGLAGYLSGNTRPTFSLYNIPTLQETKTSNPIKFGEKGLYPFSYTYIEFLDKKYGINKVMLLIEKPNAYLEILGKTEEDTYNEWVQYVKDNYQNINPSE